MMCDFNKTFFTPEEEIQGQIEHILETLIQNKQCCMCVNSESRLDTEMGYIITTTWCKLTGEYRGHECGKDCPNWKAKCPEYEEMMN